MTKLHGKLIRNTKILLRNDFKILLNVMFLLIQIDIKITKQIDHDLKQLTKLKGMNLDHDFYVIMVNNVVKKMRRWVTHTIPLYKLTDALL